MTLSKGGSQADSISKLAVTLSQTTPLLCLDEFQVTDIADAMILVRLLDELYKHFFVLVTTSNRPPDQLYENGIQRKSFLSCIASLKAHCHVFSVNSGTDYRLRGKPSTTESYLWQAHNVAHASKGRELYIAFLSSPFSPLNSQRLQEMFSAMTRNQTSKLLDRVCCCRFSTLFPWSWWNGL